MTNSINPRGMNEAGNMVFLPYDAKAPVTEVGKRTAKIMYKRDKSGKIAGTNSCLLVAPITSEHVTEVATNEAWHKHIVSFLESEQDKLIRALHVAGNEEVTDKAISLDAILTSLNTETVSARLTKDTVNQWFNENLADTLTVAFADKLGVTEESSDEDVTKVERIVATYKGKFAGLASNVTVYPTEMIDKLMTALDSCEVDKTEVITSKVIGKLESMKQSDDDLMMNL